MSGTYDNTAGTGTENAQQPLQYQEIIQEEQQSQETTQEMQESREPVQEEQQHQETTSRQDWETNTFGTNHTSGSEVGPLPDIPSGWLGQTWSWESILHPWKYDDSPPVQPLTTLTIKKSKISYEERRELYRLGILIESEVDGDVLNPAMAFFLHVQEKKLEELLKDGDEFTRSYINMAKGFYFDKKGELQYRDDVRYLRLYEYFQKEYSLKNINRSNSLIEELFGPELTLIEYNRNYKIINKRTEKEEIIHRIHIRANTTSTTCPCCGKKTTEKCRTSGSFTRDVLDIPTQPGVPLHIFIEGGRRYYCRNSNCPNFGKMFDEQFGFLVPQSPRTNRLNALILCMAIDDSFRGVQRTLGTFGVNVGDDSIRKMLMKIQFKDDKTVEEIGVDDIADHKGMTYYTVIYNLKDHRILTILGGRDGVELEKWLDDHPNVKLICRDRASAYAVHIDTWATRNGKRVEQIADRFHLIQNCIDHLRKNAYKYLPLRIAINKNTGEVLDQVPAKVATVVGTKPDLTVLEAAHYDNEPVYNEMGEAILADLSLNEETPEEVPLDNDDTKENSAVENHDSEMGEDVNVKGTTTESRHNCEQTKDNSKSQGMETVSEKLYKIAKAVRIEFDPTLPKKAQYEALAEKYMIKITMVKKFVQMPQEQVEEIRDKKPINTSNKSKEIDKYKYIIYKLFNHEGATIDQVFWYIKEIGYKNTDTNLLKYIILIYKIVYPEMRVPRASEYIKFVYPCEVEVISRSDFLRHLLIVNSKTQKNAYIVRAEELLFKKYPEAETIRNTFQAFHSVIMGDDVNALKELCKKECPIPELQGFYKHILDQDLEAVSNAIKYTYSSGVVEGNNNRVKVIKRVSYGRLKLETLLQKCLIAFWSTLDGFELGGLVTWVPLSQDQDRHSEFWEALAS